MNIVSNYIIFKTCTNILLVKFRVKYGTEYKQDYRIDGGGTTRPLSTQRRNCRPACRRPFPACSTALCVWLLAVQAATACSARVPPRALCSHVPPRVLCSCPSTRRASVWAGARSHTFVCMRLRRAWHDDAVTRCKNCHADAPRIHAARPPFIPAAIYLHLSSHTTQ